MYVLLDLFVTFFEIGLFTIGGGYAIIPLIQQEVVAKGWINMMDMNADVAGGMWACDIIDINADSILKNRQWLLCPVKYEINPARCQFTERRQPFVK